MGEGVDAELEGFEAGGEVFDAHQALGDLTPAEYLSLGQ
jgi:hypothetical protein